MQAVISKFGKYKDYFFNISKSTWNQLNVYAMVRDENKNKAGMELSKACAGLLESALFTWLQAKMRMRSVRGRDLTLRV